MTQQRVVMAGLVAISLLVVGCATKKHVREEVGKSEAKLAADIGRVEGDLGQEKTRVSGIATQVVETRQVADQATKRADEAAGVAGQAASRAAEAGTRAEDASAKAGQALAKADEAGQAAGKALAKAEETDGRLTRLWTSRNKRNATETVVVLFGFDKWQLDDRAQTALLELVKQLQGDPTLTVELEGFTDSTGDWAYNIGLSQRRAEAVRRFLVEKGVELPRINSIGLGDVRPVADNKTKQGRDQNRRVAVRLFSPAE
jgi:outer membrane protein OmpA-like peptidoglycan-associated protein